MNKREARTVLKQQLEAYRKRPYRDLAAIIGQQGTGEVRGDSGASYQLEVQAFWDDKPGGNVRVRGAIDDGGWRALLPMSLDFIKAPDESFIGE